MFTHTRTKLQRRLKQSFIGSLVFAVAIFVGYSDQTDDETYQSGSIIKTAHAATSGDGGGCGGCGGASGGCGGCCGGDTGG